MFSLPGGLDLALTPSFNTLRCGASCTSEFAWAGSKDRKEKKKNFEIIEKIDLKKKKTRRYFRTKIQQRQISRTNNLKNWYIFRKLKNLFFLDFIQQNMISKTFSYLRISFALFHMACFSRAEFFHPTTISRKTNCKIVELNLRSHFIRFRPRAVGFSAQPRLG